MPIYEIIEQENGQILQRTDENGKIWSIPMNESNADYQAYLESLNETTSKQSS